MHFIENQTPEKLRGGYYTNPQAAAFLAEWVLERRPASILEPSCGDGVFFRALADAAGGRSCEVRAWELEPAEAAKTSRFLQDQPVLRGAVVCGDFLKFFLWEGAHCVRFDAVVGNPPFIRYQYLSDTQQEFAEKIFARFGLPFTKHTNAWVTFVIASLALLRPGGRLAMVLPAELLHIRHALGLRRYLMEECSKVLVLDPEEIHFKETLQGTVLLLAEKKESRQSGPGVVAVHPISGDGALLCSATKYFDSVSWVPGAVTEGKWTPLLLSSRERALLKGLAESEEVCAFTELAEVDVGIVTGANQFFLVPDETVQRYALESWAHPMYGRSEHVRGVIYSREDHEANRAAGLPANFLWFDAHEPAAFPVSVQDYLRLGEEQGLPKRYKCRVREPWYRVPSVYASPVGMLKRSHHFPRLILNRAAAFTTDTAYRVKVKSDPTALVCSFVNSLTCLSAELEGRHYGGGVLELVPSEIERLLLPRCKASELELDKLDEQVRSGVPSGASAPSARRAFAGELGSEPGGPGYFASSLGSTAATPPTDWRGCRGNSWRGVGVDGGREHAQSCGPADGHRGRLGESAGSRGATAAAWRGGGVTDGNGLRPGCQRPGDPSRPKDLRS